MILGIVTGDLREAMRQDYDEIQAAGATPEMSVCVASDFGDGPEPYWHEIGGLWVWGRADMSSVGNLCAFIDWSVERCPAESYALIIGGHGSGPARDTETYRFNVRSLAEVDLDNAYGIRELKADLAYDDGSRASMSIADLGMACRHLAGKGPLACVVLDACFMASIEVAEELMGAAATLVASPEPIPAEGFDYTRLLRNWQWRSKYLLPIDGSFAKALAWEAVQAFSVAHQESTAPRTRILALDLTKMQPLLDAMDEVGAYAMRTKRPLKTSQRTGDEMAYLREALRAWGGLLAVDSLDATIISEWSADGEGHGPSAYLPERGPVEEWFNALPIASRAWGQMVKWAAGG